MGIVGSFGLCFVSLGCLDLSWDSCLEALLGVSLLLDLPDSNPRSGISEVNDVSPVFKPRFLQQSPNGKLCSWVYPLVMTNIAVENHHFDWQKSTTSMFIFNSYIKLLEDISLVI